jgi:hypothetical protein
MLVHGLNTRQGWSMEDKNKWRIRTSNQENIYSNVHKITKIMLGSTCNQNGYNRNSQKINWMGNMFIKTSGKTKIEMSQSSRRGSTENESPKLEREV